METRRCAAKYFQVQVWARRYPSGLACGTQSHQSFASRSRLYSASSNLAADGFESALSAQQTPSPPLKTSTRSFPNISESESLEVKPREEWQIQKSALKAKFPAGWQPRKRLSPDAIDGIKALHAKDPEVFRTASLSQQFKVSPEAIRRILKSKWRPSEEEQDERKERWERRGQKIWTEKAAEGYKAPQKWRRLAREQGLKKPRWRNMQASHSLSPGQPRSGASQSLADRIG